jgi:SAM-dependent methyltransferase
MLGPELTKFTIGLQLYSILVKEESFPGALALVRRTYAGLPLAVRVHAVGRFLTCPFLPVLAAVPPGSRLLDLGAGHGTFARLAVERAAASAVAVEPDWRKVLATYRHPRVHFVAGYAEAVAGTFGAVSLFDVLYRIPLAGWDPLLRQAFDRLEPGGVLLLKEIDPGRRAKALWNRAQEKVADLLGMTLGEAFTYETQDEIRARLTRLGFERFTARDIGAGYPHAHVLYTARRPIE